MSDAAFITNRRLNAIKSHVEVTTLIVMRSCVWSRTKSKPGIRAILDKIDFKDMARQKSVRLALKGGITTPFCLYADSCEIGQRVSEVYGTEYKEYFGTFLDFTR